MVLKDLDKHFVKGEKNVVLYSTEKSAQLAETNQFSCNSKNLFTVDTAIRQNILRKCAICLILMSDMIMIIPRFVTVYTREICGKKIRCGGRWYINKTVLGCMQSSR